MKFLIGAFSSGLLFGFGLAISEMTNPGRVVGFLDVVGAWDPTLLFVMGGALAVTLPGFAIVSRRPLTLLRENFSMPTKKGIDAPLIAGAAIFGVGWGLAGFCPGPALAALSTLSPSVAMFVVAMIAGQWVVSRLDARITGKQEAICDDS